MYHAHALSLSLSFVVLVIARNFSHTFESTLLGYDDR